MKIINKTNCKKAEEFLIEKLKPYNTENLEVKMIYGDFRGGLNTGYCKYPMKEIKTKCGFTKRRYDKSGIVKITAEINKRRKLPDVEQESISTTQFPEKHCFIFNLDKEEIRNDDENMVWILGHEVWHFLCKTKQERGNRQTKANANGFKWLREFKTIS